MKYNKQFIILGNKNAITYKEIFPLIMHNQIWLGVSIHSGGRKWVDTPGPRWFTNMDHHRHNETLCLFRKYHDDPSKYPHYDNYDAIEVSKIIMQASVRRPLWPSQAATQCAWESAAQGLFIYITS